MKRISKGGINIGLVLVLTLSLFLIMGIPAAQASIDNQVHTVFNTGYWHMTNASAIENGVFPGTSKENSVFIINSIDSTGESVIEPLVTYDPVAGINIGFVFNDYLISSEPTYIWQNPDIPENAVNLNLAGQITGDPFEFTPGFSASRSFSQTQFTGPGTQVLNINATPVEGMDSLQFMVSIMFDSQVNATITGATGDGNPFILPDGRTLSAIIFNPSPATQYSVELTIAVSPDPGVTVIDYHPMVRVGAIHDVDEGDEQTSSLNKTLELGTWSVETAEDYSWHWVEPQTYGISFPEVNQVEESGTGTITGTVIDSTTSQPIANVPTHAFNYNTWEHVAGTLTDANGNYTLEVPGGTYIVSAGGPANGLNYVNESYNNKYGLVGADPVSVTAPGIIPNINFSLQEGGTISGNVIDSVTSAPIVNFGIAALDYETGAFIAIALTDTDGNYMIIAPAGNYRVSACASCFGIDYIDEFYDNAYDQEGAMPVPVTVPNDTPNIDFSLGTVSSPFGYSVTLLNNNLAGPAEFDFDTQGNIYVANEGEADVFLFEDFISKLAPDGETIALKYIDGLEGSSGIAVDEEGNIYVSQNVDLPLLKYSSNGSLIFEFEPHRPDFSDPNTLTLTDDGRLLAGMASTFDTSKWRILAFDIQTGNRLADFTPEFDSNFVNSILFKDGQLFIGHQPVDGSGLGPLLVAQEGSMPVSLPFNFPLVNLDGLAIGNTGVIYATSGEELLKILSDGSVDVLVEGFTFARGVQARDDYVLVVDFQEGYNGSLYRIDLELVGTITGTVIDSTTSQPIPNIQVRAESLPMPSASVVTATTDSGGNYTLVVPPGTYQVRTCGICSGLNYVDEYYDGQYFFGLATPVEVTASGNTPNINFSVEPGAVISGNVNDEATSEPIPDVFINAYKFSTFEIIAIAITDASGNYAMVVPTGSYRVETNSMLTVLNYVNEYYDDNYALPDADPVEVTTIDPVPDIDFSLEIGGTVTGTVIDGATSQPVNFINVSASDFETDEFYGGAFTDPNGNYTLRLPAGTYRIRTNAFISGLNYTDEYYDDTYIFEEATPVSVTVPDNTPGINFDLEAIPNQVFITARTNYNYRPVGNTVPSTTATASPWIYSNLANGDDASDSSVFSPVLNLSTTKPVGSIITYYLVPGSTYTWTLPDIVEKFMYTLGASVIEPMVFTTGFSVTRSIDQTFFPPAGGTQTITLVVTPEEPMGRLDIYGNANFGVFQGVATITSVSGNNIFADPGGQWFHVRLVSPEVGVNYQWQVTIQINPLPAGVEALEYNPNISVQNVNIVNNGSFSGNSISNTAWNLDLTEPLGEYAWQATGNYQINWEEIVTKQVFWYGSGRYIFPPPAQEEINQAIDDAIAWVRSQQDPATGAWYWGRPERGPYQPEEPEVPNVGMTAFAVLSMLHGLVPQTDPQVQAGIQYILSQQDINPASNDYGSFGQRGRIYETGLAIMALRTTNNPAYLDEIALAAQYLINSQNDEDKNYPGCPAPFTPADWAYGGWDYNYFSVHTAIHTPFGQFPVDPYVRSDMSNSQFAIIGLKAAEEAGIEIDPAVWQKAQIFINRCHMTDGGFGYQPASMGGSSIGTITVAAVWCLRLMDVPVEGPLIQSGLAWLDSRPFDGTNPAYNYRNWFLWSAAKAFTLSGRTPALEQATWYSDYANYLIDGQQPDGKWANPDWPEGESDLNATTCGLLVLEKAVLPPPPGIDSVTIERMRVEFDTRPDRDKIKIFEAYFQLDPEASYDLAVDDVTVSVDGVSITIPAGSFDRKGKKERYRYNSKGGSEPRIQMELDFDRGKWSLMVDDIDASAIDSDDGVVVTLMIGYMLAGQNVPMWVDYLEYPPHP